MQKIILLMSSYFVTTEREHIHKQTHARVRVYVCEILTLCVYLFATDLLRKRDMKVKLKVNSVTWSRVMCIFGIWHHEKCSDLTHPIAIL